MSKTYRLAPDDLQPVAEGHGLCIATSRVTVDGQPVGHMYREAAAFPDDSGWRFTAGTESEAYGRDPDNWDVIDVNLIANLDREIVAFLGAPIGAAFVRWPLGAPLRSVADVTATGMEAGSGREAPPEPADAGTGRPASELGPDSELGPERGARPEAGGDETTQQQALNRDWWIELPGPYSGFLSNGALQLVSVNPPPRRVWVDIRNATDGGTPGIAALMVRDIRLAARPSGAVEYDEPGSEPGEHRIGFWYEEHREGEQGYWTLYTYTIRDSSFVQAAFLSSRNDPEWALTAWRSLRYRPGTGQDWEPAVPDDE